MATGVDDGILAAGNPGPVQGARGDLDEAKAVLRKALGIDEELGRREGPLEQAALGVAREEE